MKTISRDANLHNTYTNPSKHKTVKWRLNDVSIRRHFGSREWRSHRRQSDPFTWRQNDVMFWPTDDGWLLYNMPHYPSEKWNVRPMAKNSSFANGCFVSTNLSWANCCVKPQLKRPYIGLHQVRHLNMHVRTTSFYAYTVFPAVN